jgi:hypothetical protein
MTISPEKRHYQTLRRVDVRVPASEIGVIRKAAEILRSQGAQATMLQTLLGFGAKPKSISSALDIFATAESLSPEGETLWNDVMAQIERDRRGPNLTTLNEGTS